MTEKEVYKPNCCTECTFVDECFSETRIKCNEYETAIKEYHRGLSEGRKDFWRVVKNYGELEKENAELKEKMGRAGYRIAELKMQIDKMKCCENCKHHYWNYGDLDCRLKYSCYDTNYDKWELAE